MTILIKPLVILSVCAGLSACGSGGESKAPNSATTVTTQSAPADTTAPVIEIAGGVTSITINQGDSFSNPVATATDDVDGIISVSVSGLVGSDVGNYTLTYSARDNAGNAVSRDVVVTVIEVATTQTNPTVPPVTAAPSELGIELDDWYLSIPSDLDGNGKSDSIKETELVAGYSHPEYFYTSADGGIVMRSPSRGFKTSTNTSYVRVELREMLRRGNTNIGSTQGVNANNWVFGHAPTSAQANAGGINGELNVTLAVNEVTTNGENYQIGRVIIGQIHANDDEPIRLYYRKLPNNSKGAIYFAHEPRTGSEVYVEMIGSRDNTTSNPADGIALNEKFSYTINASDALLTVTIAREGKDDVVATYNMTGSQYEDPDQYMYFKVGVYHLNNTSDPSSDTGQFAQATFYEIRNSHDGYVFSE
ncbi:MAG: polysaccharide lyase family 7 protein [Glaciecola sp.]|nr:polysaccharide lyase family 7 protein [Glaciecola sp.]MDG2099796.1 polysaccharide lyase family 7 protein [Glaciecola sp.]